MKKILTILAGLYLITSACSKEDDFTSFIRGKIDGVAFEATSNIKANEPEASSSGTNDPTLRVTGNWGANEIKIFILGESSSINSNNYGFQVDKRRSVQINIGGQTYFAGTSEGFFQPPTLLGSGSITITSISKKSVKGNFQFTSAPSGGVVKTVTDGEFHVERK